jgi:hypothetical protein
MVFVTYFTIFGVIKTGIDVTKIFNVEIQKLLPNHGNKIE